MKKKFTGFILSFCLLCMGLLAGCSLVGRDYDRYYNQVVAKIENKENNKTERKLKEYNFQKIIVKSFILLEIF